MILEIRLWELRWKMIFSYIFNNIIVINNILLFFIYLIEVDNFLIIILIF